MVVRYSQKVDVNQQKPWLIRYVESQAAYVEHFFNTETSWKLRNDKCINEIVLDDTINPRRKMDWFSSEGEPNESELCDEDLKRILDRMLSGEGVSDGEELPQEHVGKALQQPYIIAKTGEYIPQKKQIRIYYNMYQFDEESPFDSWLLNVLSHEMFHAYHHAIAPRVQRNYARNYLAEVVSESTAEFFAYWVCWEKCNRDICDHRLSWWKDTFYTASPYSKALCFFFGNPRCVNTAMGMLFGEVVALSAINIKAAYERLVPKCFRV